MYNISWDTIIKNTLPPRLYNTDLVAWLSVLIQSVQEVHSDFVDFTDDIDFDLTHNCQVVYLEAALNDNFDPTDRTITIEDAGGNSLTALYPDADEKEVLLQPDSDGETLLLYPDSEYDDAEYDFIVVVPFSLTESEQYQMQALLDKYKLASKRYYIKITG